jgi:hypothetical protein
MHTEEEAWMALWEDKSSPGFVIARFYTSRSGSWIVRAVTTPVDDFEALK